MIDILISSDNKNLVELIFKEIIRKNNQFRLSDYTNNREDTLESILQYHPDVIIIDLQMLKIEDISSIKNVYSPYIIAISYIQEKHMSNSKIFYAIIDKEQGFTEILNSINKYLTQICKEKNNKKICYKIKKELKKFNINISSKGTNYLIDSILLSYDKDELNLTRDVYPVLSEKYKVKPMNIKWNMEKNVKSMRRYTENDIIEKYFYIDSTSNLTIKTVVKTISDNIKNCL